MSSWIDKIKCSNREEILEWMGNEVKLTNMDFCQDADKERCRKNPLCIRSEEELDILCQLDEDNEQLPLF